jgi:hypothetical protein
MFQSDDLPKLKVAHNNIFQLKAARKRQRTMKTRQDRSAVVDDVTSVLQSYYSAAHFKEDFLNTYGPLDKARTWSEVVADMMSQEKSSDERRNNIVGRVIYSGIKMLYHHPSGKGRANALALVTRVAKLASAMPPHEYLPLLRSLSRSIGFELQVSPGSGVLGDSFDVLDDDKGIIVFPRDMQGTERVGVSGLLSLRFV